MHYVLVDGMVEALLVEQKNGLQVHGQVLQVLILLELGWVVVEQLQMHYVLEEIVL